MFLSKIFTNNALHLTRVGNQFKQYPGQFRRPYSRVAMQNIDLRILYQYGWVNYVVLATASPTNAQLTKASEVKKHIKI